MQVLNYIEDRFETLQLRVKIELFLLPLLIFSFLFYMFFENTDSKDTNINSLSILNVKNITMNESYVEILKNIESFAKRRNIHLENISNTKSIIKIEAFADVNQKIEFLNFLENYNSFSKIKAVDIEEDSLFVEIDFKKLYKKDRLVLKDKLSTLLIKKDTDYKLHAIVGEKVYINNKWLKINDKLDSFKVFKIEKQSVILKNNHKTLVLKLYKNETI